jgi:hypothetical protein
MREMGLAAIFPWRHLSIPGKAHKIYPYLLKGLVIDRPDQVWATEITYIRLVHGFVYLVAIMDWFSRYVVSWELSVTINATLRTGTPDIFNTDQLSQFTGAGFTGRLLEAGGPNQHGRAGAGVRQYICGTVVADGKIRVCVPERLRRSPRSSGETGRLFWVLQQRTSASIVGVSDAVAGLKRTASEGGLKTLKKRHGEDQIQRHRNCLKTRNIGLDNGVHFTPRFHSL